MPWTPGDFPHVAADPRDRGEYTEQTGGSPSVRALGSSFGSGGGSWNAGLPVNFT